METVHLNKMCAICGICDGGYIKHGSDFSCLCDAGHIVQSNELFVMRQKNRNRKPDEGVCDIRRIVHQKQLARSRCLRLMAYTSHG